MGTIHWFRRDLRVVDNPALAAAAAAGPVHAVFIHDPHFATVTGRRRESLNAALDSLNTAMGGRLILRSGDPHVVLAELLEQTRSSLITATADSTAYARHRDDELCTQLPLRFIDTPYAVAPGTVMNQSGSPFKVFTPFYKSWLGRAAAPTVMPEIVFAGSGDPLPAVPAAARWREFRAGPIHTYPVDRNLPAVDGTSRQSIDLHFGSVHPRTLLADLGDGPGDQAWARQLAWRDFFADVLYHQPELAWQSLDGRFDTDMVYDEPDHFEAWCEGRTGFPFVDAGMRQLLAEGWMHNRTRMVTASFLVKDLHLPWQMGARWFLKHLRDADVANNQLGWQWVAGCGTDAAPYFRIFNPVTQSKRFDPDGTYIRRYIPELAHLSGAEIHEPGLLADYPVPIVDHRRERDVALARFAALPSKK